MIHGAAAGPVIMIVALAAMAEIVAEGAKTTCTGRFYFHCSIGFELSIHGLKKTSSLFVGQLLGDTAQGNGIVR